MADLFEKTTLEAHASKRVSYIITTKNRAEYLKQTLETHQKLFTPEDEVIIVDGLSSDHTADVVKQYADLVDIFISEPDKSGAHALNKGILVSRGKYIKQLPDDDIIYPEAMEQAVQVLEKHPEVDLMVCGGTRVVGERPTLVYLPPGFHYGKSVMDVFNHGACGTGFIFRRSCFPLIGLLHPTNMIADQEIVLRAISRGANVKFGRINLFYHRIFEHSVTISQRRQWERDRHNLLKDYFPSGFSGWYFLKRRSSAWFIQWLLKHKRLTAIAKGTRDLGKKAPPSGPGGPLWDGGFS